MLSIYTGIAATFPGFLQRKSIGGAAPLNHGGAKLNHAPLKLNIAGVEFNNEPAKLNHAPLKLNIAACKLNKTGAALNIAALKINGGAAALNREVAQFKNGVAQLNLAPKIRSPTFTVLATIWNSWQKSRGSGALSKGCAVVLIRSKVL